MARQAIRALSEVDMVRLGESSNHQLSRLIRLCSSVRFQAERTLAKRDPSFSGRAQHGDDGVVTFASDINRKSR